MCRPTPMFTNTMRTACKLQATTINLLSNGEYVYRELNNGK